MVKKTLIFAMVLLSFASIAQTNLNEKSFSFKSKNGHEVLPQKGDWSIGLSASGLLQYAGNFLNGATATNTAPLFVNANGPAILNSQHNLGGAAFFGKYMLSSNKAIRVRFLLNNFSETKSGYVLENSLITNPLSPNFVIDKYTKNIANCVLGIGLEKRRGNNRLQGIYGAELFLGFLSEASTYSYGNDININFTSPNSSNFGNNLNGLSGVNFSRSLEERLGRTFYMGTRGYIGAEYFFAPKISLGVEVGYSLAMATNSDASRIDETFNASELKTVEVETKLKRNNGFSTFGISLDNANAGLNLFLYF
jgi:hypothetical protein